MGKTLIIESVLPGHQKPTFIFFFPLANARALPGLFSHLLFSIILSVTVIYIYIYICTWVYDVQLFFMEVCIEYQVVAVQMVRSCRKEIKTIMRPCRRFIYNIIELTRQWRAAMCYFVLCN